MEGKGQGETQRMGSTYQIRLKETLDNCWARRFDDWNVSYEEDGTTVLVGPVRDQAALHGLLGRVRDLGLTLLAVACIDPDLQVPYSPAGRSATGNQALQNERRLHG
jgi:hypothetical protein